MNNTTVDSLSYYNSTSELYWVIPLVIPELVSLLCLISAIYGMFQGIEIGHPIYAVLFTNLVVATTSTILNMFLFPNPCNKKDVTAPPGSTRENATM